MVRKIRKVAAPGSTPVQSPAGSTKKKGRGHPKKIDGVKKRRPYKQHNINIVEMAVNKIRNGMSIRVAAEKYCIPKSTLADKVKGLHSKPVGRPTALTKEEEDLIVERLLLLGEWGYPLTTRDLRLTIKSYLDSMGRVNQW